jgi:HK97 family phage prohead protease
MRIAKTQRKIEYFPILGGEIKATNDKEGITEGYLNYIGNIDFGDDRTMKGAFTKTLSDSYARKSQQGLDYLWPYLWNHDYNLIPPGGIFDADETNKGLYIKTQYNLDMQMGRELYSSFKMGTMKKQSMGYKAIVVDWVKEAGRSIRNLLEVAVMEGSAVVFPMNDLATVEVVKSQQNTRRSFYMPNKTIPGSQPPALTKDYAASYAERTQQDWVSDLWDLWYPLRNEIINAFVIGDSPAEDVQTALDQFSVATLAYVQRGIELDMTEYLQPDDDEGESPSYGWMSASDNPETKDTKAGRVLSAANHAKLTKAADGIASHTREIKTLLTAAQQQGYPRTMGADNPPQQKTQEDAEISTLLASLQISNAFRGK